MAIFILVTASIMIWTENKKQKDIPNHWAFSSGMGLLSGITSMIGNLAGSFADIYFLAMRLPKNEFIGTAAWLFFIINVFKLINVTRSKFYLIVLFFNYIIECFEKEWYKNHQVQDSYHECCVRMVRHLFENEVCLN